MLDKFKNKIASTREKRQRFLAATDHRSPEFLIATWFGSGLFIPAPGTWGTIGGLLFGIPLLYLTNAAIVFITAIALFALGLWAIRKLEEKTNEHDQSFIVIDEVVAMLMVIAVTGTNPVLILGGFLLFRLFDIWKPWPIRWADRKIGGAWGVMLDDILAAFFTVLVHYMIGIIFLAMYGFGIDTP